VSVKETVIPVPYPTLKTRFKNNKINAKQLLGDLKLSIEEHNNEIKTLKIRDLLLAFFI